MAKSNNAVVEQAYNAIYDYLMNSSEFACRYRKAFENNETNTKDFFSVKENALYEAMIALRDTIQQNAAKSNGIGNIRTSMMNVLKNVKNGYNILLCGAYKEDGYTMVCDSYCFIKTHADVDLPLAQLPPDGKWLDYNHFLPKSYDMREVKTPTIEELTSYVKLNKNNKEAYAGDNMFYCLKNEDGKAITMCNAKWLLNILKAVGNEAKCYVNKRTPRISPILLESENTVAMICPIRVFDEDWKRIEWEAA